MTGTEAIAQEALREIVRISKRIRTRGFKPEKGHLMPDEAATLMVQTASAALARMREA